MSELESMLDALPQPLRPVGGSGGLAQTTLGKRKRRAATATEKQKPTAIERAYVRLGEDAVRQLQRTYQALASEWGGTEHDQADGMVLSLLVQKVPDAQVRAIFNVGGSKIARLKRALASGMATLHTRRPPMTPWHALPQACINFMKQDAANWVLKEDESGGGGCKHRRARQYKYFPEPKVTWKNLWHRYQENATANNQQVISYSRYTQYVHEFFPNVRLTRLPADRCDACGRRDSDAVEQ